MRYALPQPYREIAHTADVGIAVEGATAEEALARLVLAFSALVAGGGGVEPEREARVEVSAPDRAAAAVALLRELLFRFATERVLPAWCEVRRVDAAGAEVEVGLGRWDPERNAEGADVKAVTWHAARLEQDGGIWRGQVVLDV